MYQDRTDWQSAHMRWTEVRNIMSEWDFSKFVPEDGIEIPPARHFNSATSNIRRIITEQMKPGQSVVFPIELRSRCNSVASEFPEQYTSRTIDEYTFRVWRLK